MKKFIIAIILNVIIWNFILGTYNVFPKLSEDSSFGVHYVPNATIVNRIEGYAVSHTNNYGYLDDDFIQGEDNIIVLGDSITEANQVKKHEKYVQLLEMKWQEDGNDIKVHNLAVAGKNASDYIYYGPNYLKEFNPEYVIIELTVNDILDAFHPFSTNTHIDEWGNIVANESFSTLYKLKNELTSMNPLLLNTYTKLKSYLIKRSSQIGVRSTLLQKDKDKVEFIDESKVDFVLGKLKETYGEKLVVLYLHNINLREQISGQIDEDVYLDYGEYIEQYCNDNQIYFIDTTDSMGNHFVETGKLVNGFINHRLGVGHLNIEGHRVIAQMIDEYFNNYIENRWTQHN